MKKTVLIIGSGIGGLVCGAILAKEGYSVRILEKHTVAGGGLHTFKRNGLEWETGFHVIAGFQRNGELRKLFEYLGVLDKLRIKSANKDGFDHLQIESEGITYKMATGRENFVETLSAYFPEEKDNIQRYLDKIYQIGSNPLGSLNNPLANMFTNDAALISTNKLIEQYTNNTKLQAILAWNNTLYGGEKDKTPAYIGAFITRFYIEGSSRFIGGSQQLADALIEVIVQNGGEVIVGNGVQFIDIQDKHIQKVVTVKGQEFTADWYISAIHPSAMFKLIDVSKIQKSYYNRIDNIPCSYSLFSTFVKFKPQSFPYLNYTGYYGFDYDDIWNCAEYTDEIWPRGCMYITPPITENDIFAQKMIINAIMNFDTVKKWENTTVGKRGEEYQTFKNICENKLLDKMEKVFPDFRAKIDSTFSATPLTIRDFYSTKEGAIYGTKKDCNDMVASSISVRTKIDNLLLTGQCNNFHGILGVPITSVLTCGQLVGIEGLLGKIV